jgi:hypothetical protein
MPILGYPAHPEHDQAPRAEVVFGVPSRSLEALPLVAPTITGVDDNCDTCFGTGEIYAKPGVYKPCPACCGGFTLAARHGATRTATGRVVWFEQLVAVVGTCQTCGHATGCDCDCCRYPLPAAAPQLVGGAR